MKYVISGSAAFYGNKGAAAMLESSIQSITKQDPDAKFTLFSLYPKQDRALNTYDNLKILSTKPLFLGPILNPLALIYKIFYPLRPLLRQQKHLKAIYECDAYLDENGISFIDGRETFLIYNVASVLPALMMNRPVVKCAQAIGPFKNPLNRLAAQLILPRIKRIMARGQQTKQHLKDLKLKNVTEAADYAFLLDVQPKAMNEAQEILKRYKLSATNNKKVVAIFPSRVVQKKCQKLDIDYVKVTSDFINQLNKAGQQVVLMAHAAKNNSDKPHNNDLPVCREIYKSVNNKKQTKFMNEEISAQSQRYIISTFAACLVSRFHAMIAALSVETPVAVIGWSHKYQEVLAQFDLEDYTIDLSKLTPETMNSLLDKVSKNSTSITKKIARKLPEVKKMSQANTDEINAIIK